jgi:ABC-2 type transport system ATP-binding protein
MTATSTLETPLGKVQPGQGAPLAVQMEGVIKVFGSTVALSGVDLEVPKGEVFGLIGPNGAGKTTTLRILAGLARPDSGLVLVDGVSVAGNQVLLREMTGYMPDFFGVYNSMTASEYLAFYASCYRVPKRLRQKVVADLLELVRLSHKASEQVDTLSRGMKQRLCLARALVHDPAVLLLDEPASGLDPRARAEMRELVAALSEMGKTIVLSSHILPELAEMCTSFGVLHEGRIVAAGPAEGMLATMAGAHRARARVEGDLASAQAKASSVEGVLSAEVVAPGLLEITYSPTTEPARILRSLVLAEVAVSDFRQVEGDLEGLFFKLTEGQPKEPEEEETGEEAGQG